MKVIEELGTPDDPITLGDAHTVLEGMLTLGAPPGARLTFRRVGRSNKPIELTCEWDREDTIRTIHLVDSED